ncbi:hypothetical protein E2C01_067226 [Portunus trituberculatus]|uniref:Uncharacterized protein n=1 Tax=Portunus trituberculatus TaxID=210409 RepID=A0A5B7HS30_PORTR|nr:hypothetical protein [Portunus trituberculatus]
MNEELSSSFSLSSVTSASFSAAAAQTRSHVIARSRCAGWGEYLRVPRKCSRCSGRHATGRLPHLSAAARPCRPVRIQPPPLSPQPSPHTAHQSFALQNPL